MSAAPCSGCAFVGLFCPPLKGYDLTRLTALTNLLEDPFLPEWVREHAEGELARRSRELLPFTDHPGG